MQHLAGLPVPSARGTSGFQVVPAGLEYRTGKNINKSELAFAVRSCCGFCVVCFWLVVLFFFFNGIIKKA